MAEVLEAMGFPSEWCERALRSATGIETAVDLLLQWQAHGVPQFCSQSVRPSSPSLTTWAGKSVLQEQLRPANSPSGSGGGPTLKLLPLPTTSSKVVVEERQQSPSSTLLPSASSSDASSLGGPSGVNYPWHLESPSASVAREGPSPSRLARNTSLGQIGPSEQPNVDRAAGTGISGVESAATGGGRGTTSVRTIDNIDCSDAVVPDTYAEERKARYSAARRAKQEKEADKARIRMQMQEDMVLRRFRHSYQSPVETERINSSGPADHAEGSGGFRTPHAVSMDTVVELQIRCPGNQHMKASFAAGAKLKDVRAYVEHQLQQPHRVLASQDNYHGLGPGSGSFSGQSARLSSDRQAERELLQAARENFEVQTIRILASAKILRNISGMPQSPGSQSAGIMYFLIPFPRQEYFTESSMESTLVEAQLVPRGVLVVQYRSLEIEHAKSAEGQLDDSCSKVDETFITDGNGPCRRPQTSGDALVGDSSGSQAMEVGSVELQTDEVTDFENSSRFCDPIMNEAIKSGRTLEMGGECVRVRELALQAAAKRMSEAARIFRAGLPLEEGETGEAFHFPMDTENCNVASDGLILGSNPHQQVAAAVLSEALPTDIRLLHAKRAGADGEFLDAPCISHELPTGSSGPKKWPLERSLDPLHRQAMAAAEARMRSLEPHATVLGGAYKLQAEEAESRTCEDEPDSWPLRGRARIPQSSRLLLHPEKLQRTSNAPDSQFAEQQVVAESSSFRQTETAAGAASRAGPLEAALERFHALSEIDIKGKGIVEELGLAQVAMPSSLLAETERDSALRIRHEDGSIVLHKFPAHTALQSVRDSVVPEGAVASAYGFVVPFPEPHFVEGEALTATLEEVGLVPRGTIHLTKLATRGMVRQGRRVFRHRSHIEDTDDEVDHIEGMFRHLTERIRPDLTYEELMDLEDSIGRVHVGVPEEIVTTLPTHIVKPKMLKASSDDAARGEEELDLCIVCMAEMADGEEALSLPCVHTFHTLCIRQWLLQSTCCPTCKGSLV